METAWCSVLALTTWVSPVTGDGDDATGDEEDVTGDEVDEVVGAVVEDIRDKYKYRSGELN